MALDRFNSVWEKIMATFQQVIDTLMKLFGMVKPEEE